MNQQTQFKILAALIGLAGVSALTACGGTTTAGSSGANTGGGEVMISGSSTVEPISVRVAELLSEVDDSVAVNVDGPGTGDGFKLFCAGDTDISDASRPIKAEEAQACADAGIEFIELAVAYDGLAVITNPDNATLSCLTLPDLYALMGPESEEVTNWSDATALAGELGSTTVFPDAEFVISAPGQESGTHDSFIELALQDTVEERFESGAIPPAADDPEAPESEIRTFPGQPDDSVIISTIEGSPSGFGWVGFAYADGAGEGVKILEIDAGEGCIAPTAETIADGSYPLSRTLYIYVNAERASQPAVQTYADFYLGDGYAAVSEVGYVDLAETALEATRTRWQDRTTGSEEL